MREVFTFLGSHWVLTGVALIVVFAMFANLLTGAVLISERQVGIVVKRFGGRGMEDEDEAAKRQEIEQG